MVYYIQRQGEPLNQKNQNQEDRMSRDGYNSDDRLLDAIEAITGGNLDCEGDCGNDACDGTHPEDCGDAAVSLWCDGGREDELRAWLDKKHPGWSDEAPLAWGAGHLEAK
jgi:hypothetical protein